MARSDRFLFISDTQEPFAHRNAIPFCKAVQKEYGVLDSNVFHVGDEVDQYFGSLYTKDPDAWHTPNSEIRETLERMQQWYAAFPQMKVCTSNHGQRWQKKATAAEIPSQMMRAYQELIEAPPGWIWRKQWLIQCKYPIKVFHGVGYGGMYAYRTAAMDSNVNTVFGHLHSNAGLAHIRTFDKRVWGLNVGCLIDENAYAFRYNKEQRNRPILGCGVVIDDGLTPIFVPLDDYDSDVGEVTP